MSARLTLPLLRRLLQDAPWTQARLRPFAGHEVAWAIAGLEGSLLIDEDGLPVAVPPAEPPDPQAGLQGGPQATRSGAEPPAARPGVHIRIDGADLGVLAQGMDALMRKVSLQGNAALAAELAFVARNLRPDPEEWLAPWLGDALAERAGRGLRSGVAWGMQAGQRMAAAGSEYLVHEARLVPPAEVVAAQCADVDLLREAADRLAQRVARLERALNGGRPA